MHKKKPTEFLVFWEVKKKEKRKKLQNFKFSGN